ncbi:hypothetical protein [Anaeromyxobacter terrae]|uniref:hypothetical protein n=1 Tax=Anaeromyxobacter terrae TaxID=2925406 RepID=UPI001F5906B2|nr:hypothetical protein [Anaeromyxobacter sp. SG22]
MERTRATLLFMAFLLAGCSGGGDAVGPGGGGGGGGGGVSTLTLSVDGGGVATSDVTTGVDAGGTAFVVAAAGDATIRLGFLGTTPGTFASGSTAGGTVTYLDRAGAVFDAADGVSGSSYTITVTGHSGGRVSGSFAATVVAWNGAAHEVSGAFDAVTPGVVPGRPYAGRYIGIFKATYAVCTSSPCGPEQSRGFRVILELDYVGPGWEMQEYDVTYAKVSDPYFGCTGGCWPSAAGALAYLPDPPGGVSSAAEWIGVGFPNGKKLETSGGSGRMLTSSTGDFVSSGACSNGLCWTGWQSSPIDWSKGWETTLPVGSLMHAQSWWLAKSAL